MAYVGGSIDSIFIKDRIFSVAADADAERDLGGVTAEYQPNGDGTARKILTQKIWMVGGLTVPVDDVRGDQEFLEAVAASPNDETISVTFASGATYQGKGSVTGDVKFSSQNALATISLSGPGKLTRQ